MKCSLVLEDWRQRERPDSIYSTKLGMELSSGDLHSGTTFEATVELPQDISLEVIDAWTQHKAYPVFRLFIEETK